MLFTTIIPIMLFHSFSSFVPNWQDYLLDPDQIASKQSSTINFVGASHTTHYAIEWREGTHSITLPATRFFTAIEQKQHGVTNFNTALQTAPSDSGTASAVCETVLHQLIKNGWHNKNPSETQWLGLHGSVELMKDNLVATLYLEDMYDPEGRYVAMLDVGVYDSPVNIPSH